MADELMANGVGKLACLGGGVGGGGAGTSAGEAAAAAPAAEEKTKEQSEEEEDDDMGFGLFNQNLVLSAFLFGQI